MVFQSLIILTMISKNDHKMTYRFNYQIQHTITEHNVYMAIYIDIHMRVYLLHAYMHGLGKFRQGWGPGPIFSRGFQIFSGRGGGVSNCYILNINLIFQGERSGPRPTSGSAHDLYTCVSV